MTFTDQKIVDTFQNFSSQEVKDRISNDFIDQEKVNDVLQNFEDSVSATLDEVVELDSESFLYETILKSVVLSINKHLTNKLNEFITQSGQNNELLTWHEDSTSSPTASDPLCQSAVPGGVVPLSYDPTYNNAPELEESDSNIGYKIPFQVHYAYLGFDPESSSRTPGVEPSFTAPLFPTLHQSSTDSVSVLGFNRTLPGIDIFPGEPNYELFDLGVEIYVMKPICEVDPISSEFIVSEKKTVIYGENGAEKDSTELIDLLDSARTLFSVFEELRNGNRNVTGSYTQSVNSLFSIRSTLIQKSNFIQKIDILKELMGV